MSWIVRKLKWLAPDKWSRLCALSCAIPLVGAILDTAPAHHSELQWPDAIMGVVTLPLAILMTGYPQVLRTAIVRRVRSSPARMAGAVSSLALAVWYAVWASGADLSGSSTAPLAVIFYPIMVQGWAWALAVATVVIAARYDREP